MPLRGRLTAAVVAVALLAAACSGADSSDEEGADTTGTDPVVAEEASGGDRSDAAGAAAGADTDDVDEEPVGPPEGTLVWVVGTEPPDFHLDDPANGLPITSWIREGLFESLFGVGPDLTYHPELLAADPTITPQDDASVVIDYRLRPDLMWSDGTPLTAEDVAYTYRIVVEGCRVEGDGSILDDSSDGCVYRSTSRLGYDQVTSFEVVSDTEFRVTMASFYPDWRGLFAPVFAAHAFGEDAGQVNQRLRTLVGSNGPLPSSGPLLFDGWDRGVSMTLRANPDYHGSNDPRSSAEGPATVEAVRIDFQPDQAARVDAILDGRADLLMERARPGHERLAEADDVDLRALPGVDYDHWGMNLLNPHLANPEVRAAVALAIDKAALVESVYGPLLGPDNPVPVQGNTYWLASQPDSVDHQESLTGAEPDRVRAALAQAGYQPGPDGIQRHPERGPLRLRIATIGGDPLRELTQELLIEQLEAVGIDAVADNPSGGLFFQQGPFAAEAMEASASTGTRGDGSLWDIAQFAWAGGPWPGAQSGAYGNGSPGNPYGFSNAEFEVAAFECDAVIDDGERAGCYNDLDRFVTTLDRGEDGLFMVPLFQRPVVFAAREGRLETVPEWVGSPQSGPLASFADFVLTDG